MNLFNLDPLLHVSEFMIWGVALLFFSGVMMGFVATYFGIGGGFFYTPFFHSVFHLSAVESVATSLGQMPFSGLTGIVHYWRAKKIMFREGFLMILGSLPSSQLVAHFLGNINQSSWGRVVVFANIKRADLIVGAFFIISITLISIYNLRKAKKFDPAHTESKHKAPKIAGKKYVWMILTVGLAFGVVQALIGIGGGFLSVPFFIYICGKEPIQAVATSLFCIIVSSVFTVFNYAIQDQVFLGLSLIAGGGSLIGSKLGSKYALKVSQAKIVKSLGYFQLGVVAVFILIKYVFQI